MLQHRVVQLGTVAWPGFWISAEGIHVGGAAGSLRLAEIVALVHDGNACTADLSILAVSPSRVEAAEHH